MSNKIFQCPICEDWTDDYPAISRTDNKTEICSRCGNIEALREFANSIKTKKHNDS